MVDQTEDRAKRGIAKLYGCGDCHKGNNSIAVSSRWKTLARFLESLFELMGMNLSVPDHSKLSRQLGKLKVELPIVETGFAHHVVIDSTGMKVYGEGEWHILQHGSKERRTWRKLHLGVNEATGEILAAVVITNNVSDGLVLPELLPNIIGEIEQVSADGAYDQRSCYDAIANKQAQAAIP